MIEAKNIIKFKSTKELLKEREALIESYERIVNVRNKEIRELKSKLLEASSTLQGITDSLNSCRALISSINSMCNSEIKYSDEDEE